MTPRRTETTTTTTPGTSAAAQQLTEALARHDNAPPFARQRYQSELAAAATGLLDEDDGIAVLDRHITQLVRAGLLNGGPWAKPARLVAPLVAGSFMAMSPTRYILHETLSTLRVAAISHGRLDDDDFTPDDALDYLSTVLALNLDHLFDSATEARRRPPQHPEHTPFGPAVAHRLFRHMQDNVTGLELADRVVHEIDEILAQRPIWTHHVRAMVRHLASLPKTDGYETTRARELVEAIEGPSALSREHADPAHYAEALRRAQTDDPRIIEREITAMAHSLRHTGLACRQHAILVQHLLDHAPQRILDALGTDDVGRAHHATHAELAEELVRVAIRPSTTQTLYGLARLFERGLLAREAVAAGLRRLITIPLRPEVSDVLSATRDEGDDIAPEAILLAGAIRVLGQPLGVGQGNNPTCQSARALSLWSQHRPGYLLEVITAAARDGTVEMWFEGALLSSASLGDGLVSHLDPELDPVSLVLVSHLDRLYEAMMQRTLVRPEDGHKWVNPALYGRMVPSGFTAAIEKTTGLVTRYGDFVRRFFATHHPEHNGGHEMAFPNPVGIVITGPHGDLVGFHAVTIQRVAPAPGAEGNPEPPQGEACSTSHRVYFFNPNNESRQDWGQGIHVSVSQHGEREGESSLPFEAFVARLYAFHYNPFEEGDIAAVPDDVVERVETLAKASWGRGFPWDDGTPKQR